jgi:hypothetical protein
METLMTGDTQTKKVTPEELMVSTLAITDALAKVMIVKGLITDEDCS